MLPGVLGELAVLYRAMQHLGIHISVVDEMELWQCAVALGFDEDYTPRQMQTGQQDDAAPPMKWEEMFPGVPDPIYGEVETNN